MAPCLLFNLINALDPPVSFLGILNKEFLGVTKNAHSKIEFKTSNNEHKLNPDSNSKLTKFFDGEKLVPIEPATTHNDWSISVALGKLLSRVYSQTSKVVVHKLKVTFVVYTTMKQLRMLSSIIC